MEWGTLKTCLSSKDSTNQNILKNTAKSDELEEHGQIKKGLEKNSKEDQSSPGAVVPWKKKIILEFDSRCKQLLKK
ncbi:hypothetical protein TNCV_4232341 [Trichonephila clavipes]|nr:hypothetical protein TNCV_4232341 [Trichonephila clavipes]